MEVDFNSLRLQMAATWNRLASALNRDIRKCNNDGIIQVWTDDIQKDMDFMRQCIVSLCCCYMEDDPAVRDVSVEIGEFVVFNPEAETIS